MVQVEVHYRQSASDPWILVGTTTDSSPNGNQLRVRFEEGANFGNIQLNWEAGFRSGSGTAGQMFDPGTYIFDGDGWVQISGNTSMTTSGGQYVDEVGFTTLAGPSGSFRTGETLIELRYEGSSDIIQTSIPDIWPTYLRTTSLLDFTDPTNSYRAAPSNIGNEGQVLQVVGAGAAAQLLWRDPSAALSVTEENATPITGVNEVIFDDRHFTVTDNSDGSVEVVLTSAASGGGAAVTDGTDTAANPTTISFGNRFDVTVTMPNSAMETATINLTDVPRHRSIEFELSTDAAPGGPTPPPDRRLQTSTSAVWVPAGMFGIEVTGQLFGDDTSFSFSQGLPPIVQIYERPGTGSVTRSMVIPGSITVPSAGVLRILFNTDIRGTIVLNGIGLN